MKPENQENRKNNKTYYQIFSFVSGSVFFMLINLLIIIIIRRKNKSICRLIYACACMGTFESFRKAYGALKDSTKIGLAKVNSEFKVSSIHT